MSDIVTIAGSPSHPSRSSAVLDHVRNLFEAQHFTTAAITVRSLPAEALLFARINDPAIQDAIGLVANAQIVVVATPVYKAAYTGILKAFLDLLPQNALADKKIFPIATGGSPAHLLAIDYALKPVLSALGAHHVHSGLYVQDSQIQFTDGLQLDDSIEQRLVGIVQSLAAQLTYSDLSLPIGK